MPSNPDRLLQWGVCNNHDNHAPVVQKVDSSIRWINHYLLDSAIGFPSTYPLDGDLSSG